MDQIGFDMIDLSTETDFTQQFYHGHVFGACKTISES